MSTPNPLANTHSTPPTPVSTKIINIAGLRTHVYGLAELPPSCPSVSILWLLHGRLQKAEVMASIAASIINSYNSSRAGSTSSPSPTSAAAQSSRGLIAISFDQRNHGTRLVDGKGNQAWREGNEAHAQDMFGVYQGTAMDTTLLIDHVGSYLFVGADEPTIEEHLVLGISLGGHAAWQILFADERVRAGIVIIGCPDYIRLMTDRARLSKLSSYTSSATPGADFLGSSSFPSALVSACSKYDPKALLFGTSPVSPSSVNHPSSLTPYSPQTPLAQYRLLQSRLAGKAILVCSGADDKLVPYHCSEPFLTWLKSVVAHGGWFSDGGVYLEDNVYAGVGHATSEGMLKDSARFVEEFLSGKLGGMKETVAKGREANL